MQNYTATPGWKSSFMCMEGLASPHQKYSKANTHRHTFSSIGNKSGKDGYKNHCFLKTQTHDFCETFARKKVIPRIHLSMQRRNFIVGMTSKIL